MSDIKVDMRVRWKDGDTERIGFVAYIFDDDRACVQDYAEYSWMVGVANLTPVPLTEQERAEFTALLGYAPREVA